MSAIRADPGYACNSPQMTSWVVMCRTAVCIIFANPQIRQAFAPPPGVPATAVARKASPIPALLPSLPLTLNACYTAAPTLLSSVVSVRLQGGRGVIEICHEFPLGNAPARVEVHDFMGLAQCIHASMLVRGFELARCFETQIFRASFTQYCCLAASAAAWRPRLAFLYAGVQGSLPPHGT